MAANEIKNLSHAGIVVRFDADPAAPVIQESWGVDESSITRESGVADGYYSVRLIEPIPAHTDPVAPGFLSSVGAMVSKSAIALPNFVDVALAVSPAGTVPPVDSDIQLDLLVFAIRDAAGASVDALAQVDAQVWRGPTRD